MFFRALHFACDSMTLAVQTILERFEKLTEPEKRDAAREILRRLPVAATPAMSDDELTALADELFQELDRQEAGS